MRESLQGKTIFITGASRGIGAAMALRFAREGANIVIAAKTIKPHSKLTGTIYSVADEVVQAGGNALPLVVDVRDEAMVTDAVKQAVTKFGGIDVLINNASAISLTPTLDTPMKRFDLMHSVNARATFLCSQACLPYLLKAKNPHILTLSPPLNLKPHWFKDHVAYTISKYGMSMCTLGMAQEFKAHGVAVNSLWPKTTIGTAAIAVHFPQEIFEASRKPDIVADAAYFVITTNSREITGKFLVDEEVLTENGVSDFSVYTINPDKKLYKDLFLD